MRDLRDNDDLGDLSFTPEEVENIARVENFAQPLHPVWPVGHLLSQLTKLLFVLVVGVLVWAVFFRTEPAPQQTNEPRGGLPTLASTLGMEMVPQTRSRVANVIGTARVRELPSVSARAISSLPAFAPVTVLGFTASGWCFISTGKQTGFVWGGLLEDCPALPLRPRLEGADRIVIYGEKILRP
jgi:hypothetical protein